MRSLFCTALMIALCVRPSEGQQSGGQPSSEHRAWSRLVASVGLSGGGSNITGEGDQCIPALLSLGIGARFDDLAGLEYDVSRMPCDGDHVQFRTVALNLYPAFRLGFPAMRVSVGVGKSNVRRSVYAGGHASDITEGAPSAASLTIAFDGKLGSVAVSPFFNMAKTMGSGLMRQYCSTPNYSSGDFTWVCSNPYPQSLSVTTVGLSLGIR
jgi:hypothetical protein